MSTRANARAYQYRVKARARTGGGGERGGGGRCWRGGKGRAGRAGDVCVCVCVCVFETLEILFLRFSVVSQNSISSFFRPTQRAMGGEGVCVRERVCVCVRERERVL